MRLPPIKKDTYFYICLATVILYAFLIRFLGVKFGLPYLHQWDEPQSASTALNMLKTGDLNPHFFNYGGFTIYSCLIIDSLHYWYLAGVGLLNGTSDIMTKMDTGWHWTISHPSFYFWNRIFITAIGTASIILTFFITHESYGKSQGILAAFLLSGFPYHIEYSRLITPDMPMCFFILLAVLFALRFDFSHKIRNIVYALIFVGLAASSKYNAILSIMVPLSICLLNYKHIDRKSPMIWLIFMMPLIVFLIFNPFAILDFETFWSSLTYEMKHYKELGHEGAVSVPGLDHFILQISTIKNSISSILFYSALIGIFLSIRKRTTFLLMIFPVIYMYFMTQQKVNFHRNFIIIYPFFAIYASVTIVYFSERLSQLGAYLHWQKNTILYSIPFLLVLLVLSGRYAYNIETALHIWRTPETRSRAVDYLNVLSDEQQNIEVGIAKELRFHSLDLNRLKFDYGTFKHKDISSALIAYDYVLVGKYSSFDKALHDEDEQLNKMTPLELTYHIIDGENEKYERVPRDIYAINPKVIILKGKGVGRKSIDVDLLQMAGRKKVLSDGSLFLPWGGMLKKDIRFRKSNYEVRIISKGNEVQGQNAHFKVYIGKNLVGDYFAKTDYKETVLSFESTAETRRQFTIEYANDFSDSKKKLDRNAWIKAITITQMAL